MDITVPFNNFLPPFPLTPEDWIHGPNSKKISAYAQNSVALLNYDIFPHWEECKNSALSIPEYKSRKLALQHCFAQKSVPHHKEQMHEITIYFSPACCLTGKSHSWFNQSLKQLWGVEKSPLNDTITNILDIINPVLEKTGIASSIATKISKNYEACVSVLPTGRTLLEEWTALCPNNQIDLNKKNSVHHYKGGLILVPPWSMSSQEEFGHLHKGLEPYIQQPNETNDFRMVSIMHELTHLQSQMDVSIDTDTSFFDLSQMECFCEWHADLGAEALCGKSLKDMRYTDWLWNDEKVYSPLSVFHLTREENLGPITYTNAVAIQRHIQKKLGSILTSNYDKKLERIHTFLLLEKMAANEVFDKPVANKLAQKTAETARRQLITEEGFDLSERDFYQNLPTATKRFVENQKQNWTSAALSS